MKRIVFNYINYKSFANMSQETPVAEDWTKKVTLSPPNEVKFQLSDEDKEKLKSTQGQIDPMKA